MEEPLLKIGQVREKLGVKKENVKDFNALIKKLRESGKIKPKQIGKFYHYLLSDIQREMDAIEEKRDMLWFRQTKSREIASNMWLPIPYYSAKSKLDSQDKALDNSWFNVSKISVHPNIRDKLPGYCGPIPDPKAKLRVTQYRLYLTSDIIKKYISWFDLTRWIYNKCVEFYYKEENKGMPMSELILKENILRNPKFPIKPEIIELLKSTHVDTKETPIRDFIKALTYLESKKKESERYAEKYPERKIKIFEFTMKFRLKRDSHSFCIRARDIKGDPKELSCYPTFTKELGPILRCREGIKDINHSVRVVWNGVRGKGCNISVHVPRDVPGEFKIPYLPKSCSIDPGERTFISVYGSDGDAYTIGDRASRKIDNLGKIAESMRRGIKRVVSKDSKGKIIRDENNHVVKTFVQVTKENTKNPSRTLRNLKEKSKILEARAKRLLFELHHKAVKFLTDKYDTIIIPKFNTKSICEKLDIQGNYKRNIGKDVARRLQRLSHFKFRELLIAKGGERVYVGTEEYTSKACGYCFNIHENLGGNHTFECPKCSIVGHRDLLAARNIMILNAGKARLNL